MKHRLNCTHCGVLASGCRRHRQITVIIRCSLSPSFLFVAPLLDYLFIYAEGYTASLLECGIISVPVANFVVSFGFHSQLETEGGVGNEYNLPFSLFMQQRLFWALPQTFAFDLISPTRCIRVESGGVLSPAPLI